MILAKSLEFLAKPWTKYKTKQFLFPSLFVWSLHSTLYFSPEHNIYSDELSSLRVNEFFIWICAGVSDFT